LPVWPKVGGFGVRGFGAVWLDGIYGSRGSEKFCGNVVRSWCGPPLGIDREIMGRNPGQSGWL
jgi:hypothetical protein